MSGFVCGCQWVMCGGECGGVGVAVLCTLSVGGFPFSFVYFQIFAEFFFDA